MTPESQETGQPATPLCLVVEDQPEILRLIVRQMEKAGWSCLESPTAGEAHDMLGRDVDVQLAIIDLTLPDSPGEDLAAAIRERSPSMPIVVTSGRAESELEAIAEHLGNAEVLCKPFSIKHLRELGVKVRESL